jgi:serine O-acetyltransferase
VIAGTVDPVWARLRREAEEVVRSEPSLAGFALASVLNHHSLEVAIAHRVAGRLGTRRSPRT